MNAVRSGLPYRRTPNTKQGGGCASDFRATDGPFTIYRLLSQMRDEQLLKSFGKRIRDLRTKRAISQEHLAELTGFHRTYIGMIERGERNLSLTNVGIFAKTFEISIAELLDFTSIGGDE